MSNLMAVLLNGIAQLEFDREGQVTIDLVFDEDYIKQYPVTLNKLS